MELFIKGSQPETSDRSNQLENENGNLKEQN